MQFIFSLQELKQYLLDLAEQPDSLFGRTVTQFVACTRWVFGYSEEFNNGAVWRKCLWGLVTDGKKRFVFLLS